MYRKLDSGVAYAASYYRLSQCGEYRTNARIKVAYCSEASLEALLFQPSKFGLLARGCVASGDIFYEVCIASFLNVPCHERNKALRLYNHGRDFITPHSSLRYRFTWNLFSDDVAVLRRDHFEQ